MTAILILAAGEASRMGQPKQLMKLRGQSLLQRAVQTARQVSDAVIVVTGAYSEEIRRHLAAVPVTLLHNAGWRSGMGSSISTGMQQVIRLRPAPEAVVIMLCDQPLLTPDLLRQLIRQHQQTEAILVAATYQNTTGVPALFDRVLFPELLALEGKAGARKIISRYATQLVTVAFPEGRYDVDTPEDFERIQHRLGAE